MPPSQLARPKSAKAATSQRSLWGRSCGEVDRSPESVHCPTLISQSITLHSTNFVSPLQSPDLCSADTGKKPQIPRGRPRCPTDW
ncbi:hypothetical protein CGRA01v4_12058 [Colletotrichum graminicola]|nr:hypothetical protein CGRA01v4_12058 [Colletotrichum graminicola]